ncbi:MAG: hypothetical protein QXD62_00245 [Candidatus Woesearchaeota archaeon]
MPEEQIKPMKKRPWDVTLVAVLYIIFGVFSILVFLLTLLLGGLVSSIFLGGEMGGLGGLLGGVIAITGILIVIVGILNIAVGIALLKGKSWARILVIIFSCLGLVFSVLPLIFMIVSGATEIMSLVNLLVTIIINGLIFWDFTFRKEVKEFFTSKQ